MKCEKQRQKHLEFVVPTEVYLVLIGTLSLLPNPKSHATRPGFRRGHSIGPLRPIHRPGKCLATVIGKLKKSHMAVTPELKDILGK